MNPLESSQDKIDLKEFDNEATFLDMVEKYQDAIFRYLYFRVSSRSVAIDITQDTFTKVWIYIASGKNIDYPEAFIYRSAKNALIDYYKKEKSSSLDYLMESGYDPSSTKDTDEILRQDDISGIKDLLEDLDEDSKQIIHLRFVEELPIEEIALIYKKSSNAMTVYIHRLIKKIRIEYDKKNGK